MLLSLKHKFIFIHIPKTGGTSIRNVLEQYSDDIRPYLNPKGKVIINKRIEEKLSSNPPHISLISISKIFDLCFKDFTIICVIRNPLERIKSYYKYLKFSNRNQRLHELAKQSNIDLFVERFISDDGHDTFPQFTYFARLSNLFVKNYYFLRFESLNQDFNQMQNYFGMKNLKLGRLNKSEETEKLKLSENSKKRVILYEKETVKLGSYNSF